MKLTRAGFGVLASSVALVAGGRLFGLLEFYVLAAMAAFAVGLAIIYSQTRRLRLTVTRSANPGKLRSGASARVDVQIRNKSRQATPVMAANDKLPDGRGASVLAAPIPKKADTSVSYQLPTSRRGELMVGPLMLTYGDPLGLTTNKLKAAGQTRIVVHANLVPLTPLVNISGAEASSENQPIQILATSGQEFFALRPYVIGDDLRRVNWGASARSEELMVRQEEEPETGKAVVLLDVRSEVYSTEGFERAVSAALSIVVAVYRENGRIRFATTASATIVDVESKPDLERIDERLALIATNPQASLAARLEELCRKARSTTAIIITGSLDDTSEQALAYTRQRLAHCIVISTEPPGERRSPLVGVYDEGTDLRALWAQLLPLANQP